jgi:hypothetical protein
MECHHPIDPAMLDRVKKDFCIRLDWPGKQPLFYTIAREDVAHCLMHVEQMKQALDDVLKDDIRRMITRRKPDHGLIKQALFYLCTHDPIYEAAGGVPVVDFAYVQPAHGWSIRFGRQEPGPTNVRMIESVSQSPSH